MNARYYVPSLGRFASADTIVPDPANPQSFNRFSYVFNQPLIYTDPSGHCPWCIGAVVGVVGGALTGYGVQVYENIQQGHSFVNALTTDISAKPILTGAGVGLVLGGTLGVAAPVVAPYITSGMATAHTAAVTTAATYPTTTAVAGGVAETVFECTMTGGGCTPLDYAAGAATAGISHRLSTPQARYADFANDDASSELRLTSPYKNYYDVIAHGLPNSITMTINGRPYNVGHRNAARFISNQPGYTSGQPIRLLSCDTGSCPNGFAQNLANKMGVPVMAPTHKIWPYPGGDFVIGPHHTRPIGKFNTFYPGDNVPK